MPACPDPDGSLVAATAMAEALAASHNTNKEPHAQALYKDCWTGDLIPPPSTVDESGPLAATAVDDGLRNHRPRSARLPRRPKESKAKPETGRASGRDRDGPSVEHEVVGVLFKKRTINNLSNK